MREFSIRATRQYLSVLAIVRSTEEDLRTDGVAGDTYSKLRGHRGSCPANQPSVTCSTSSTVVVPVAITLGTDGSVGSVQVGHSD